MSVAFELKAGVNRVEVNVQERDETIVITSDASKPFTTADPALIEALDLTEGLKRVEGRAPAASKPQEPPKGSTGRTR